MDPERTSAGEPSSGGRTGPQRPSPKAQRNITTRFDAWGQPLQQHQQQQNQPVGHHQSQTQVLIPDVVAQAIAGGPQAIPVMVHQGVYLGTFLVVSS